MPINPVPKPTVAQRTAIAARLINWGYVAMFLAGVIVGYVIGYVS